MTTQEVWEVLGKIPIGTIVAWGAVFVAIIAAISVAITKLFGIFTAYRNHKAHVESTQERLQRHDQMLENIDTSLKAINEAMKKSMRYDLVRGCEAAIAANSVKRGQRRALEELYEAYAGVGGNQYATTLMKKVRQLPVDIAGEE